MENKIKELKDKALIELDNTVKALEQVKNQIEVYKLKGQELSAHANMLQGKLNILNELGGKDEV